MLKASMLVLGGRDDGMRPDLVANVTLSRGAESLWTIVFG